jgi:hypothetical protein
MTLENGHKRTANLESESNIRLQSILAVLNLQSSKSLALISC